MRIKSSRKYMDCNSLIFKLSPRGLAQILLTNDQKHNKKSHLFRWL